MSTTQRTFQIKAGKKLSRKDIVFSLVPGSGEESVYFGSSDGSVYLADFSAEKIEPVALTGDHRHTSYVTGLARTGKGRLVSGSYDRRLIWWDTETGKSIRVVEAAHGKWIRKVKASPDGKIIASVADDMVCRIWDAETATLLSVWKGHEEMTPHHYPSMLFTCEFSPDGAYLATADKVGLIVLWDVASGKMVKTFEAPIMYTWDPNQRRHSIGGVRSLAFSPDGKMLAVGGMGKVGNIDHLEGKARVSLFHLEKGEVLAEIETGDIKGLVQRLAFHPRGEWLLASGGDNKGFAVLIDPQAGKTLLEEKNPPFHVHDFMLNSAANGFIAAGHNQIAICGIEG